jgi:hypothetical protein
MLTNDTISRSFDASSVSVKALGLTITTFKVQELLGTSLSKSTAGPPSSEITLLCLYMFNLETLLCYFNPAIYF